MSRATIATCLALGTMLGAPRAHAWESVCYQYSDNTLAPSEYDALMANACSPSAGPNTARNRWIGGLDEHRRLFETTRALAGLPDAVSANVTLRVFTGDTSVMAGGTMVPTLVPIDFAQTRRAATRVVSVGELAQLPDFSYALWDWATGHETCPLDGVGADAASCHGFATHMGPVNANHFVPISREFYAHYHALALARAAECARDGARLGSARDRYKSYLEACESEAIALEAVGQHYLQDAWSSGHMWSRWGSPDLADFPGDTVEEQRARAVMVALVSGFVHGSRGVLQALPDWTSFDVNDALCAPNDAVEYAGSGVLHRAIGDDYLALLEQSDGPPVSYRAQANQLFACATSGLRAVYLAAGSQHGALAPADPSLATVDPTSDACFGQRITNRAFVAGAGIQFRIAGAQVDLPVDSRVASLIVPNLSRAAGDATITPALRDRFRLDLVRAMALARIAAIDAPTGTDIANGALGDLLGAHPNGQYPHHALPAPYVDPPLPWPTTPDTSSSSHERATALARMFHRAHATDWCNHFDATALQSLRDHATDPSLDAPAHAAACEVCGEIVARHLRVGAAGAYDTSDEPVCHYLATTPAYVYRAGVAGASREALAQAWCGCP